MVTQPETYLDFDGVADRATVPHSPLLNVGAITVEVLFNPRTISTTNEQDRLVSKAPAWQLSVSSGDSRVSGDVQWRVTHGGVDTRIGSNLPLSLLAWHWAKGVYDPSSGFMGLYIDDVLVESTFISGALATSTDPLVIGNHPTNQRPFDGLIGEVRIWDFPKLETGSVNTPLVGNEPGLVAYYLFNETGQLIQDSSQNGIHGFLGSGPLPDAEDPARFPEVIAPPVADFTANPALGPAPLSVAFNNLSVGHTSWIWDMGDGTILNDQDPGSYIYTLVGTYTVRLTVFNESGQDTALLVIQATSDVPSVPPLAEGPIGMSWAPPSSIDRSAAGSDTWPITWGNDGDLYTAWGDGNGFNNTPRRSMGFAKVSGFPPVHNGQDIRSDDEQLGDGRAGKKASGMLMVGGVLYMWVRNANNDGEESEVWWSTDLGSNWSIAPWRIPELGYPTFVNYGRNYSGARDSFVYSVSHDSPSAYNTADSMVLMRVPSDRILDRAAYEFFVGLDSQGNPIWNPDIAQRGAVFSAPSRCWRSSISYNPALGRYLWWQHGDEGPSTPRADTFGVYEAPEPWGPWTTAYFTPLWDADVGETGSFPTKWMSEDGASMFMVFSGDDSFSVRQAFVIAARFGAESAITNPLDIQFGDLSIGATSWAWEFGDGQSSLAQNPSHVYASPGEYTVQLTVGGPGGTRSALTTIALSEQPPPAGAPAAAFSFVVEGLNVAFTDESLGQVDNYFWNYDDGNNPSPNDPENGVPNPRHTYLLAGTYSVSLTVTNAAGSSTTTRQVTVEASEPLPPPPSADFTAIVNDLTVSFINRTTGLVDSYAWDFGDGATSSEISPTHVYAAAGTFTARLTAMNSGGGTEASLEITVNVPPPGAPVAGFTIVGSFGVEPHTVLLSDASSGVVDEVVVEWGDGSAPAVFSDPPVGIEHVYSLSGVYTILYTVSNISGQDSATQAIIVDAATEEPTKSLFPGLSPTAIVVGGGALLVGLIVINR